MNQGLSENEYNIKSNLKEVLKIIEDEMDDEEEIDINNEEDEISPHDNEQLNSYLKNFLETNRIYGINDINYESPNEQEDFKNPEKKEIKLKLNNKSIDSIISKIIEKNSKMKQSKNKKNEANPNPNKKIFKIVKPSKEVSLYDLCKENVVKNETEKRLNKVVLDINSKDYIPKSKRVFNVIKIESGCFSMKQVFDISFPMIL